MGYRYTYVDLENVIKEIDASQLNYAGTFSTTTQYFINDVVLYNSTRYIALSLSLGFTPPVNAVRDDQWSALVFVSTGTSSDASQEQAAFDLATDALRIAITGTNLAQQAYNIGVTALHTAWNGTELAQEAYDLAYYVYTHPGTSSGTSGGGSDPETYALARLALDTAWAGTLAGNQAYNVGYDAYRIAIAGTNAANAADLTAREAYSLAMVGTDAAHVAYSEAVAAYDIAVSGTIKADRALYMIGTLSAPTSSSGGRSMVLCSAYTPLVTGGDAAEVIVPYDTDGLSAVTWNSKRLEMRVQTTGTGATIIFEKSTGAGAFSAVAMGTLILPTGDYEVSGTSTASVLSGDKVRFNIRNLGTTQNWTVITEIAQ